MGDATRLRQILINLMGNAVKFTHQGHVTLRVGHGPNRQGVVLEVVDTGIGIPEDRLQTIFEAFEQANATSTDEYGGTGLGLEISRRLVGLMGGELSARSTVGVGSVFRAVLPLVAALDDAIEPEILNYDTVDVTRRHIMIAEDNRTNQLVLRHMLTPLGAELTFCKDGIEVVDHFAQTGADVVLMDLSMPRRDGITATKVIRLSAGMNGFLTKPLRKAALLAEIGRLLPEIDCSPTSAKAS